MSTRRTDRRPIGRRAALAAAVVSALAIAAPAAQASAATPPPTAVATVTGPTLTGDVFNGPTEIVTACSAADGTTGPTLTGDVFNRAGSSSRRTSRSGRGGRRLKSGFRSS